jgi:hypothetical protein
MKCALEMGSGFLVIHTKFHKDWFRFRHSEIVRQGCTYRQQGDFISLLVFFSK